MQASTEGESKLLWDLQWVVENISSLCKSRSSYIPHTEGNKQINPLFAITYKLVSYSIQIQLVLSTIKWINLGCLMVLRK